MSRDVEVNGKLWTVGDKGRHERGLRFMLAHYAGCSELGIFGEYGLAFFPDDLEKFLAESVHLPQSTQLG